MSHLKMDGWNTILSFWDDLSAGAMLASGRVYKGFLFCLSSLSPLIILNKAQHFRRGGGRGSSQAIGGGTLNFCFMDVDQNRGFVSIVPLPPPGHARDKVGVMTIRTLPGRCNAISSLPQNRGKRTKMFQTTT